MSKAPAEEPCAHCPPSAVPRKRCSPSHQTSTRACRCEREARRARERESSARPTSWAGGLPRQKNHCGGRPQASAEGVFLVEREARGGFLEGGKGLRGTLPGREVGPTGPFRLKKPRGCFFCQKQETCPEVGPRGGCAEARRIAPLVFPKGRGGALSALIAFFLFLPVSRRSSLWWPRSGRVRRARPGARSQDPWGPLPLLAIPFSLKQTIPIFVPRLGDGRHCCGAKKKLRMSQQTLLDYVAAGIDAFTCATGDRSSTRWRRLRPVLEFYSSAQGG